MGKSAPKIPKPPDPAVVAQAQAEANRINQFTPFGTLEFSGKNRNTATTTLSPDQQQILDLQENLIQSLGGRGLSLAGQLPSGPLSFSGLPQIPTDLQDDRANVEQAVFDRGRRLLDPVFETQERRLRDRLANQGLPQGSEAFTSELDTFGRGRDEALLNLSSDAVRAGGAEQSRLLSDALSGRGQLINEQLVGRSQPFNEVASLLGLQQLQQPSFFAPSPVDVTGAFGLQQQGQLANAQLAQQQQANFFGGLSNLGSAGALLAFGSARRLKRNGRPISVVLPRIRSLHIEAWDYLPGVEDGGTHIGPYAEDFHAAFGVGNPDRIHMADVSGICLLGIQELTDRVEALENA